MCGVGFALGVGTAQESSPSTRRAYAVPMVPGDEESAMESESEVEEDCDLWLDGAGRQWRGRQHSLGSGTCLVPALMGPSGGTSPVWGLWRATWGGRWLFSGFFACRWATTGVMGVQTELGHIFMRQSTKASGEFPASLACVVHTWKFGAFFRRVLVSGSLVSSV